MTFVPKPKEHWITVYQPVRGWVAVEFWLNDEESFGPFPEPWATSPSSHDTEAEAIAEGRWWAKDQGIKFVMPNGELELAGADTRRTAPMDRDFSYWSIEEDGVIYMGSTNALFVEQAIVRDGGKRVSKEEYDAYVDQEPGHCFGPKHRA